MRDPVKLSESGLPSPAPFPAPQAIIPRKLCGMVLGAVGGVGIGWLMRYCAYPFAESSYHLCAGALAGAVIGSLFAGKTLGWLGWGIVVGTGIGAIIGSSFAPPKGTTALEGASIGFILGVISGLSFELFTTGLPKTP